MTHIIRKGMFETNSSSMHSLVIDNRNKRLKKDYVSYMFMDIPSTLRDVEGYEIANFDGYGKDKVISIDLSREPILSFSRQSGIILMTAMEKLYLYLTLSAYHIWGYGVNIDADTFLKRYSAFVEDLRENFFKPLGITLNITLPKVSTIKEYKGEREFKNYDIEYLPYVEDSDQSLEALRKLLSEDKDKLYSFLFSFRSFAIIGGDEYTATDYLTSFMHKAIDYDCIKLGAISFPDEECDIEEDWEEKE